MPVDQPAVKTIELAIQLVRSYPAYPTTFSTCSVCQRKPARGGMACPDCLEDELTELIGDPLAREFHHHVKGAKNERC